MSQTAAFKRNPIDFLSENLLITQLAGLEAGPCRFSVVEFKDPYISARLTENPVKTHKICVLEQSSGGGTLNAVWLPWQEDNIRSVLLDRNQFDFLFTFTLTGCSIGIGHSIGNKFLISHANAADAGVEGFKKSRVKTENGKIEDATLAQQKGQEKLIGAHHLGKSKKVDILAPTLYRMNPETSEFELDGTAFGRKEGKNWSFYVQRYRLDPDKSCFFFHPSLKLIDI